MARKRITTGCLANDATQQYCPTLNLNRAQMAVFLVRAKMNNVYPLVISGCPQPQAPACPGTTGGDNFGLTVGTVPYFADATAAAGDPFAPYFLYIQKMYELRITNGLNRRRESRSRSESDPHQGPDSDVRGPRVLLLIVQLRHGLGCSSPGNPDRKLFSSSSPSFCSSCSVNLIK